MIGVSGFALGMTGLDGPIKEAHLSVAVRDYLHCLGH